MVYFGSQISLEPPGTVKFYVDDTKIYLTFSPTDA